MPVSDEYAARTACRDHARICTRELRGSLRGSFYSDCEFRSYHGSSGRWCKFSHTIFNTTRVLNLGGESRDFLVQLNYGYGFERYGAYENWADGWNVIVNGENLGSSGSQQKTYDIPKSLLLAEHKLGMKAKGDPEVKYDKVQSICTAHYQHSRCQRIDCRYDHNLVDAKRIESLVRWSPGGMSPDYETLTVECRVTGGRARWKVILKPDAFAKLSPTDPLARTIPPRPFSYEDEDLLKVIRHMERVVGLTPSGGGS
ncbi:hypothetical protein AX16_004666 [Volvariella volvacea WC 439]|nr:hypothetical protein AX16_004666 [Volvariella volvacea WC 439]